MDVESQIADLTRRVAALEKTAKAQDSHNARAAELLAELKEDVALLRRHAISTGQKVEEIDKRLGALEARMDKLEVRMEKLEVRMEKLEAGLEGVRGDIAGLRRDLPGIIADTMREVLREGR